MLSNGKSKQFEKCSLFTTKMRVSFPLTQSQSGPFPKFWRYLQSWSNPNATKFATVRIQSSAYLWRLQRTTFVI